MKNGKSLKQQERFEEEVIQWRSIRKFMKSYSETENLRQALSELKRDTGIDYQKLIMGDRKERMRVRFKHWQENMNNEESFYE